MTAQNTENQAGGYNPSEGPKPAGLDQAKANLNDKGLDTVNDTVKNQVKGENHTA